MLRRPGSSWGFGALLKGTSVVVLRVERALYIHSPHLQFLPARDSNSQPFDYESDSLTIRPRLPRKYVNLLYMYSILGRGYFCFNYCLNSAWHGGDQFVALLVWKPSLLWQWLSAHLHFLVSCFSFSSWEYPIDSLWGSGLVSLLASQAHQHHGHLTNFWCFWHCGQVPNPAGKWNQHL